MNEDTPNETLPEEEALEMTPESLAEVIKDFCAQTKQSREHRDTRVLRPGDLKALAQWERQMTKNYGVEKRARRHKRGHTGSGSETSTVDGLANATGRSTRTHVARERILSTRLGRG